MTGRQDAWIANIGTLRRARGRGVVGDGRLVRWPPSPPPDGATFCSTSIPTTPRAPPASTGPRFRAPPPVGDLRDRGHQPVGLTCRREAAASERAFPFPCYGRACSPSTGSSPGSRTRSAGRWSTTVATCWWWRAPAPARPPRSPPVSPASSPGTPPERVLLLTFSRRAAAELLRRAGQLCGADVAGRAWGGTFHAVANRLLRIHGRALGLTPPSPCSTRATPPTCSPSAGRSSTPTSGARPGPSGGPPARTRWPPSSAGASTPRRRCRGARRHFPGAGRSATS